MGLGAIGLAAIAILSLSIGKYSIPPADIVSNFVSTFTGSPDANAIQSTVLWNVRLPRVLAGVMIGAALAAAGATYQGLFRNPLVSPDILGVSAGASLGAVLAIFFGMPVLLIQVSAFCGGLLSVAAVYSVGATIRNRDPLLTLVLAGVAIGAVVGAGISLINILADPYDQLPAITYWLLGSLTAVTRDDVAAILPAVIVGFIPMVLLRWRMNLMTLGDEEARALGVDIRWTRFALIAGATLVTAASVSIAALLDGSGSSFLM